MNDTARNARRAGARVAIQILYYDRKGPATWPCVATQRCDTTTTRPGTGYDTNEGRPRQGGLVRHNTAGPVRSVLAAWAMGVCTLCT